MYRLLRLPSRPSKRLNTSRRSILGLSVAALGVFLYSRRIIHADAPEEEEAGSGDIIIYTLLSKPGKIATPTAIYQHSKSDQTDDTPDTPTALDEKVVKSTLEASSGSGKITGKTDVGIRRFDSIAVPSSLPRLDTTTISSTATSHGSSWTIFSLHEGLLKYGWKTMDIVSQNLHAAVVGGLLDVFSRYEPNSEHSDVGAMMTANDLDGGNIDEDGFERIIHQTFKEKFLNVDRTIIQRPFEPLPSSQHPPRLIAISAMNAALSGCSALVAFYDHEPRKLRVANTGNVRGVLGRRSVYRNNGYDVHVLSEDHTSDAAPGLSRVFGAGPYKWSRDIQEQLHRDYLGDPPIDKPPHSILTAEPSVTTVDVKPGDFLVLATQGLWNSLTNEEVVGLVGLWLDRGMMSVTDGSEASKDAVTPLELPVPIATDNTVMYKRWGMEKRFLCIDDNVAQHLARNALGGADISWTSTLLASLPPRSLDLRDDISITVVFFDDKP